MAAGNYDADIMYTIALSSIVNIPNTDAVSKPVLHVQPVHDLLVAGKSNVSQACMGYDQSQGRRLLQLGSNSSSNASSSSSSSSTENGTPQVEQLNSTATSNNSGNSSSASEQQEEQQPQEHVLTMLYPARFRVQYQLNDSSPVFLGEYAEATPPPKIVLDLEDKEDVSIAAQLLQGIVTGVNDNCNSVQHCIGYAVQSSRVVAMRNSCCMSRPRYVQQGAVEGSSGMQELP
jgi:hypothetical protein